ncbi:hypothetical protein HYH03_010510 [Edaphochlamys debaryana]|nr:hypothetical protein HYH03_010510 [Edaphochlamys debaryana]|eukprot:KAG2491065.1 hypothetical protein HYH03_010510 [Edaphochlamys debaryana]
MLGASLRCCESLSEPTRDADYAAVSSEKASFTEWLLLSQADRQALAQATCRRASSSLSHLHRLSRSESGCAGSTSQAERPIGELLEALRGAGLDAALVQPAACSAASPSFCMRHPYLLIHPSPETEGDEAGPDVTTPAAVSAAAAAEPVLIETCLRELFRAAPSTPEYAAAVEALPEVWVGPRCELLELAGCMCTALALNFREQGLHVPPWRRRTAVMARWDLGHLDPAPANTGAEAGVCAEPGPGAARANSWPLGPEHPAFGLLPAAEALAAGLPRPELPPLPPSPPQAGAAAAAAAHGSGSWSWAGVDAALQGPAAVCPAKPAAGRAFSGARGPAQQPARVVVGFALPETARAG